jgi:hypothetical protein
LNHDGIVAIKEKLWQAEDNCYRARCAFDGQDLTTMYGESGRTKESILAGYEEEVERWTRALKEAQRS